MTARHFRRRTRLVGFAGLVAILIVGTAFAALSERPVPPCGVEPFPNYPALDATPNFAVWSEKDLAGGTTSSSCMRWQANASTLVVALAGRFHDSAGPEEMLARIGAVSSLRAVRYWSVTEEQWNQMFSRITALDGPDPMTARGDFSPAELRSGKDLYLLSADSRTQDEIVSRLRLNESGNGRMVVEMANVTPLRWFFVTFAAPGNLQTWYVLEPDKQGGWRFYSLTRVLYASSFFARFVKNESYINRSAAMYRHIARIPTDRDPPVAP